MLLRETAREEAEASKRGRESERYRDIERERECNAGNIRGEVEEEEVAEGRSPGFYPRELRR